MTKKSIPLISVESQDIPLCKCGCGEPVTWSKWNKQWNTFINNHHCKGRHRPLEVRAKISKSSIGKQLSEETKRKLSEINKGKKHSEETKYKMSLTRLEAVQSSGGNISKDGYCHAWGDREYIKDVKMGHCEHCGISEMMCLKIFGYRLSAHHKNGKMACAPEDISTLCHSCHMKLHRALKKENGDG